MRIKTGSQVFAFALITIMAAGVAADARLRYVRTILCLLSQTY